MNRLFPTFLILCLLSLATAGAADGKVKKVLPHFLDREGRHALSPSLYDRDAYQVFLRDHPEEQSGMRFDVHYKTKGPVWSPLTVRVELRGTAEAKPPKSTTLERTAQPAGGILGRWIGLELSGEVFREFGKVTAWRVTLWEGDTLLSEQKSFLW